MGNKNQNEMANNFKAKKSQTQQLTILYEIKDGKNSKIRIFNKKFVDNNKNKCTIFINGKKNH